jgi:aldehyde dehydrogenase (NAD+)
MSKDSLIDQLQTMRKYYDSGITRPYAFRKQQLQKLKSAILQNEQHLHDGLYADLKKSPEESWVTETGFLISEINSSLKNLRQWMQPEKVKTNLVNLPSSS